MLNLKPAQKIAIALNLILVACSSGIASPIPTSQPFITETNSAMPPTISPQMITPELALNPTSSSLPVDVQTRFYDLLKDNAGCELPCFLGVTPGKTLWINAKAVLEVFTPYNQFVPYLIDSNTQNLKQYTIQIVTTEDVMLSTHTQLTVDDNDLVRNIIFNVEIFDKGSTGFYDKHLLRYSLSEIFRRHGMPDNIYFDSDVKRGRGYDMNVVYEKLKMVIHLGGGNVKEISSGLYEICPDIGDGNISGMKIALANPSESIDVKALIGYPFWEGVPPFEEVAGMSINDFYKLLISDQQPACFNVK